MTFEQFCALVAEHVSASPYSQASEADLARRAELLATKGLRVEWVAGGRTGGSCYDSDRHESLSAESEPEFEVLDSVLLALHPEITLIQYRAVKEVIYRTTRTQNEYYGNYTTYNVKAVDLRSLYERLRHMGVL